jgi:transcriptional regulator with XRE-family HTH domain
MSYSVEVLRKDAPFVPEVRSPTVRRRELGALLRKLRTEKGLTVEQAAERLMISMSKLSRMETGHGAATPRDIRDLCDLYDVTDEAERDRMLQLAREGKQQGWWQGYDLPYSNYVGLEAEATSIRDYDSAVVPGLLQTADYARALHEAAVPTFARDVIEQRVAERLTRQRLLVQEEPPQFWTVMDEAVLRRAVGGQLVMRAQLERIIEAARMPTVTIQVVPYAAGAHPALDSTFTILDFVGSVPSVVYVEGLVGWIYLERPDEVDRYYQVFDRLRTLALSPQDTISMVASVLGNPGNSPGVVRQD